MSTWSTVKGSMPEIFLKVIAIGIHLEEHAGAVARLLERYTDQEMQLADACLVRMTETAGNVQLLTTDADFRIYRRHGRQAIPCLLPR